MTNRAGTLVSNLSGEMAYGSFRPAPLPPNPPIEVSGELFTKLMHSSQEVPDRSRSHLQHTQESCQRLRPILVPPYSVFCSISFRCGGLSIERNQKPLTPEITPERNAPW